MKTFLMIALSALSFNALASNVAGTNLFPGYGAVPSDRVCLTADSVKTDISAYKTQTCVKYSQGLNGESCIAYKTVMHPAAHLEAPLSFDTKGCVESKTEFTTSLTPKEVCVKYGTVTYNQPRYYSVVLILLCLFFNFFNTTILN